MQSSLEPSLLAHMKEWDQNLIDTGWPRTLENRENGQKKFPAGKNQGIKKNDENQGKISEFEKKNILTLLNISNIC